MALAATQTECFVCRKHRERGSLVPGGPAGEDDLVIVSHLPPGNSGRPVYLGHLFVEPRRHAPGLADLTDAEARGISPSQLTTRCANCSSQSPAGFACLARGTTPGSRRPATSALPRQARPGDAAASR